VSRRRPRRDEGARCEDAGAGPRARTRVAAVACLCGDESVGSNGRCRMRIRYALFGSRFGEVLAIAHETRLAGLYFVGQKDQPDLAALGRDGAIRDDDWPVLAEARRQIGEYEGGRRDRFDLPIELAGTEF